MNHAAFHPEHRYLDLLADVVNSGERVEGRNGAVRRRFGRQLRFAMADGLPVLTTKRLHLTSIVEELFWFLRGETNARSLQARGVTIWDEWADKDGDLGPIYGHQWRSWPRACEWVTVDGEGIDQIAQAIRLLRTDPLSRRILVSAWNVDDLPDMALPPCHFAFQFHAAGPPPLRRLSLMVHQRSADVFLGLPFNIASYAILLHLVAQVTGMIPDELIFALGDVHLYEAHLDAALLQLSRQPAAPFPTLADLEPRAEIDDYGPQDIRLVGYQARPAIRAEVVK